MTMTAHTPATSGLAITELLKRLRDDTTQLLRDEVALAKQEMSEKASEMARSSGYLVAGGLVAYAGALVLMFGLAAVVYGLLVQAGVGHLVAGCAGLLLVGAVVGGGGAAVAMHALSTMRSVTVVPERTVETLQRDKEWISRKVRR